MTRKRKTTEDQNNTIKNGNKKQKTVNYDPPVKDKFYDTSVDKYSDDDDIDDNDIDDVIDDGFVVDDHTVEYMKHWTDGLSKEDVNKYEPLRKELLNEINNQQIKEIDIIKAELPMEEKVRLMQQLTILNNMKNDNEDWLKLHDIICQKLNKTNLNKEDKEKMAEIVKYMDNSQVLTLEQKILRSKHTLEIKKILLVKYKTLKQFGDTDENYVKLLEWITTVLDLPTDCIDFNQKFENAYDMLYSVHMHMENYIYGQTNVKERILEMLGRMLMNPVSKRKCLALVGPPGVGKTLFARALAGGFGLPFYQVSLGGMKDSSILKGHSYTYIGAKPGIIASALTQMKHNNGIIYLDELDKIQESEDGGKQVISTLIHILDFTQNHDFRDMYMPEIPLNLSNIFFVLSFNDINKIDKILLDRLEIVHMEGYMLADKLLICKKHIIPKIISDMNFGNDIHISDDVIAYIINKSKNKEAGVRQLERNINKIFERINLLKMLNKYKQCDIQLSYHLNKIVFPMKLTIDIIDKLFDE